MTNSTKYKKNEDYEIKKMLEQIGKILLKNYSPRVIQRKNKLEEYRRIGLKNNAVLLNESLCNKKDILNFKVGNEIINISRIYFDLFGWPKDLSNYLMKQTIEFASNDDHLERLRLRLLKEGATLLDKEWKGWRYKYEYIDFKGNIGFIHSASFPKNRSINYTKTPEYYLNKLENHLKRYGCELVSKEWHGGNAKYTIRNSFGDLKSISYCNILSGKIGVKRDENGNEITHIWRKQANMEVERYYSRAS